MSNSNQESRLGTLMVVAPQVASLQFDQAVGVDPATGGVAPFTPGCGLRFVGWVLGPITPAGYVLVESADAYPLDSEYRLVQQTGLIRTPSEGAFRRAALEMRSTAWSAPSREAESEQKLAAFQRMLNATKASFDAMDAVTRREKMAILRGTNPSMFEILSRLSSPAGAPPVIAAGADVPVTRKVSRPCDRKNDD